MDREILIINGHPSQKSFTSALAQIYQDGVKTIRSNVKTLNLAELEFDLNLHEGYRQPIPLEPDIKKAQELIQQADHLVFFYPLWWGSSPALLKGFIDRVFLPGYAFKNYDNSYKWDPLLVGKSAEIWLCSDAPKFWLHLKYWDSPIRWLKSATLEFCGIKPVKVHIIDRIRFLNNIERKNWLDKAFVCGQQQAQKIRKNAKLPSHPIRPSSAASFHGQDSLFK